MCGIAGFYNLDALPAHADIVLEMNALQRHRGPDDTGVCLFSLRRGKSAELAPGQEDPPGQMEGALGFNRLSILDLSSSGHQPMYNRERSVLIAFNGEVYNAFSYRAELMSAGYAFRSSTDTEVILHLYEEYGFDGMLARLNGMFAIVVVDLRSREVLIARDHMGIKPLYWTLAGSCLLFASEAKAFLAHPRFHPEIDERHLDELLTFRFVAGEDHLLKGVRQLRPGHFLRATPGGYTIHRYWAIPDAPSTRAISQERATEELSVLLNRAIKSQLQSDVPVGCQLSGGIDSSLVTAHARLDLKAPLDAFSIVFDNPAYSEEKWIKQAAAASNVSTHCYRLTDQIFFDTLSDASWYLDQPISHPNSIGIALLAKESKRHVTVLLSGEGADEVFGGYTRFYYASLRSKVAPWLPILERLPRVGARLKQLFSGDPAATFIASSIWMSPDLLFALRPNSRIDEAMEKRRAIFDEGKGSHMRNCLKYEMQTYMVDLLIRQDKMTMAHSVENRVPFLDLDVVNFARGLQQHHLTSDSLTLSNTRMRGTKVVLKNLARKKFNDSFVYRKKSGFGLPLDAYYADKRFRSLMEDLLLPGMARRGLVDTKAIRRWWDSSDSREAIPNETLWIPLALEIWAQQFLGKRLTSKQTIEPTLPV